ncbi:MAG: CPBP family intramembrane metalloprotease [Clostridium sp.]|jgi:membrane protease YdiL (CAAX protease family)|nr:CPBP family intramembrane metalloprotease [Clostridium sp.]
MPPFSPYGSYPYTLPPVPPEYAAKRELNRFGNLMGFGLLAFELIGTLLLVPLIIYFALGNKEMPMLYTLALNGLSAFLALGCVFALLMKPLGCRDEVGQAFGRPKSKGLMLFAVMIGIGLSFCAEELTSLLMNLLGLLGIESSMPDITPTVFDGSNIAMYVIQVAISPALLEEFAFRGVMMQTLRRYGDGFAIVMSAFVFGMFHGNIVQTPFAFMLGLVMGYLAIATGSVWTAVAIHFLNNLNSVLLTLAQYWFGDEIMNKLYYMELGAALIIGAIGAVMFFLYYGKEKRNSLKPAPEWLPRKGRAAAFLGNPGMLILFGLLLINMVSSLFLSSISDVLSSF